MVTRIAESRISMLANLSKIAGSRCGKKRIGGLASLPVLPARQDLLKATTPRPQQTTLSQKNYTLPNATEVVLSKKRGGNEVREHCRLLALGACEATVGVISTEGRNLPKLRYRSGLAKRFLPSVEMTDSWEGWGRKSLD
jgi:hypothetical protein